MLRPRRSPRDGEDPHDLEGKIVHSHAALLGDGPDGDFLRGGLGEEAVLAVLEHLAVLRLLGPHHARRFCLLHGPIVAVALRIDTMVTKRGDGRRGGPRRGRGTVNDNRAGYGVSRMTREAFWATADDVVAIQEANARLARCFFAS